MSPLLLGACLLAAGGTVKVLLLVRRQRREIARLTVELARHQVWVAYKSESPVRLAVRRAQ